VYRGAQRLAILSAYFRTCDDCQQAAADFASDMSHWLDEQFERLYYMILTFGLRVESTTPDDPGDIYPREEGGRVVTTLDFLNQRT
jgi:hypothetical protein